VLLERGEVEHLEIDLEADVFELLLGHAGALVMVGQRRSLMLLGREAQQLADAVDTSCLLGFCHQRHR
jgi:hypothetical protein